MPLEFDNSLRLFRVVLEGRIDVVRVLQILDEMFAHAEFSPGIPAVWIADNADLSPLTRDAFRQFSEYQRQHAASRGRARIAFVSANDLSFGLGRMFEQSADLPHLEINVFRDVRTAEDWVLAAKTY